MLSPVLTKAEDVVETPSGRLISPSILTWAFKDVPGLQRSQVVAGSGTLRAQRCLSWSMWLQAAARRCSAPGSRWQAGLWAEVAAVTGVRRIALTADGKTRFVVNECCQVEHGERPTLIT